MQDVERFRKRAIFQHWWIVACSLLLGITGLFMFLSWVSPGAWGGYAGVIHRIGAVGFVAVPVLYFLMNPKSSLEWLKETFTWGVDDLGWLQAAPTYYFGGPEEAMPPQGRSNTGQKLWMLVVVVTGRNGYDCFSDLGPEKIRGDFTHLAQDKSGNFFWREYLVFNLDPNLIGRASADFVREVSLKCLDFGAREFPSDQTFHPIDSVLGACNQLALCRKTDKGTPLRPQGKEGRSCSRARAIRYHLCAGIRRKRHTGIGGPQINPYL